MRVDSAQPMNQRNTKILFFLFLLSGFSGLLYQVIWLRLAFAKFGVITPVISVVVSIFMMGLGVGSWLAGKIAHKKNPLLLYGLAELIVGIGAISVPPIFDFFSVKLLALGEMNSGAFLLTSGLAIGTSILPWCIMMGTTFPLGMAFLRTQDPTSSKSFSFLYLGNVIGAMLGTWLTAKIFIEAYGFRNTLLIAGTINFTIAAIAFLVSAKSRKIVQFATVQSQIEPSEEQSTTDQRTALYLLFTTGFVSMAMEVAWTRAFTPILNTSVYSFAFLLTTYLFATWVGSWAYRKSFRVLSSIKTETLSVWMFVASLFVIALTDPRFTPNSTQVFFAIFPICAIWGYLTPGLVDHFSRGAPNKAGVAYAVNVLGCILGPLIAGYVLLPLLGVKGTLILISVPFLFFAASQIKQKPVHLVTVTAAVLIAFFSTTFEDQSASIPGAELRRDHTATVISYQEKEAKHLLVNGIGITILTPITKFMAHLPLGFLDHKPDSALVICFGMGTTLRSLASWGIHATAVELVPSVKEAFGFYHKDAAEVLAQPNVKVVIDDGRRYMARTQVSYDVITLDPPPPLEAAGSSLLYSREFYALAREHLKSGGILQQWFPGGDAQTLASFTKAIQDSFPYVKVFRSIDFANGYHFFASDRPIQIPSVQSFIAKLPPKAKTDLMEWYGGKSIEQIMTTMLGYELPISGLTGPYPATPMITDNRPFNEYFSLRGRYPKVLSFLQGVH